MISLLTCVLLAASASNAPDFTLTDVWGGTVTLSEVVKNGPALLIFWTSCCQKGPNALQYASEIYENKKDKGLNVLGINLDGYSSFSKVKRIVEGYGWGFPVLVDPEGKTAISYKIIGVPATVIVDRNMKIVFKGLGFSEQQKEQIEAEVDKALK